MSEQQQIVDGYTMQVIRETPLDEVPESARYVYYRNGQRVENRAEADQVVEIVRVVRFTFDRTGRQVPAEEAYNGFLKFMDRQGVQHLETFIQYQPDAGLAVPPSLQRR